MLQISRTWRVVIFIVVLSGLLAALAFETETSALENDIAELEENEELKELDDAQSEALLAATRDRELSDDAFAYFLELLRLDQPLPGEEEEGENGEDLAGADAFVDEGDEVPEG